MVWLEISCHVRIWDKETHGLVRDILSYHVHDVRIQEVSCYVKDLG
jgi:hypothetical protein